MYAPKSRGASVMQTINCRGSITRIANESITLFFWQA